MFCGFIIMFFSTISKSTTCFALKLHIKRVFKILSWKVKPNMILWWWQRWGHREYVQAGQAAYFVLGAAQFNSVYNSTFCHRGFQAPQNTHRPNLISRGIVLCWPHVVFEEKLYILLTSASFLMIRPSPSQAYLVVGRSVHCQASLRQKNTRRWKFCGLGGVWCITLSLHTNLLLHTLTVET